MPWQRHVADLGLAHVDGLLCHRDVDISVPRQQGKSLQVLCLIIYRMLAAPSQWCVYGAQSRLKARTKLLDVWWPRLRRSPLGTLFTVTKGTGMESLRAHNGSILTLLSEDETSGHGDTVDLAVLDECWSQTAAAEQAVVPAMITNVNAQLWRLSTAGTAKSVYWRSRVDAGRIAADLGVSDGAAYVEWAADPDDDVTDPAVWLATMPALCPDWPCRCGGQAWAHTISLATVRKDLTSSITDPSQFKRSHLNLWPDETNEGWAVVPRDVWEAAGL